MTCPPRPRWYRAERWPTIFSDSRCSTSTQHRRQAPVGTDYATTYTQTWNFNLQHEFAHNIAVEAGYVGNKGTHLQASSAQNVPLPGPGNVQARRPYPQWGVLDYKIWGGSSTYHSLQAKFEKRFSERVLVPGFLHVLQMSRCARQRRGQCAGILSRQSVQRTLRLRCAPQFRDQLHLGTSLRKRPPLPGIGAEGAGLS